MVDDQVCDELEAAAGAGDWTAFQLAVAQLAAAMDGADAARAGHLLDRIAMLFASVPPAAAGPLAVVAAALVELGARPEVLVAPVVAGLGRTLSASVEFAEAWRHAAGPKTPAPAAEGGAPAYAGAVGKLTGRRGFLGRLGAVVSPADAARLAGGWFSSTDWARAATVLLSLDEIRAAFPERRELARLVARLTPVRPDLRGLGDLLVVLDDEPMIVLHRTGGRGWIVRLSGIVDNAQLRTLLIGELASEVDEELDAGGRVADSFELVDAAGKRISDEARPVDIAIVGGWRVVVLDPPSPSAPSSQSSPSPGHDGRAAPATRPRLRIEELMTAEAAARWLDDVAAGPAGRPKPARPVRSA